MGVTGKKGPLHRLLRVISTCQCSRKLGCSQKIGPSTTPTNLYESDREITDGFPCSARWPYLFCFVAAHFDSPCYINEFALGDWPCQTFIVLAHRPRQRGCLSCPTIANNARFLTTRLRFFPPVADAPAVARAPDLAWCFQHCASSGSFSGAPRRLGLPLCFSGVFRFSSCGCEPLPTDVF